MGAEQFQAEACGKTAAEAFAAAQEEARYDHGHSGYTGTIAEKTSFVMAKTPAAVERRSGVPGPYDVADAIEAGAEWVCRDDILVYNNKWGPALCLKLGDDTWLFFGIASS